MSLGLPVSSVANISVSLAPAAASYENFDSFLVIGDSSVIDTQQRIRQYSSIEEVGQDFLTTAPEYLAADIFFSQTPQPNQIYIGRWASKPTGARLVGGVLTTSEQTLSNWTSISNGSFSISIDGALFDIEALDFATDTNLNGVASAIQTALQTASVAPPPVPALTIGTGGTLAAGTVYAAVTFVTSYGESLPSSPANVTVVLDDTISVASPTTAGTEISGFNVYAGATAATMTKQNAAPVTIGTAYVLSTLTTTGSVPPTTGTASTSGSITATCVWTYNGYFQFESGTTGPNSALSFLSPVTPSSGVDISSQLMGTETTAQYVVDGVLSETPAAAVNVFTSLSTQWFGLEFATSNNNASFTDSDALAVAAIIEAFGATSGSPYMFGVTTQNTAALSATATTDIGAELQAAQYTRTFAQYSSSSPYACAGIFGILLTVDFAGTNTMVNIMWKVLAGVSSEILSSSQAAALNAKRYNYFALFNNGSSIIVNGTMASSYYIDEIFGMDAFANAIQTDIFNLFVTSPTKIAQTDPSIHQIVRTIESTCDRFVNNGFLAPGVWTSSGFGILTPGYTLSKGFMVYAPPVASQSVASRALRQTPTISVAAKEAGAINDVIVSVGIDR